MAWGKWTVLVGGVLAIIAQWMPGYYLALIGGLLAVVGALGTK